MSVFECECVLTVCVSVCVCEYQKCVSVCVVCEL